LPLHLRVINAHQAMIDELGATLKKARVPIRSSAR
jgi:hypothetical protein